MDETNVLDHGYVKLVDSWGSDSSIIEAARMSTNKGTTFWGPIECDCCHGDGWCEYPGGECGRCSKCKGKGEIAGDEKLLRYLYTHKHMSPFEMCGLTIEVQAPIMVFREWHRHRTQSYNEMSARYTPLPDVNYMPTPERCLEVSNTNKQAGALTDGLTYEKALDWLEALAALYEATEKVYQAGLTIGIPKELARLCIPVGRYSRMRASANLRNWMQFLTLRLDASAQKEIRFYAQAVETIAAEQFPRTMALFQEGQC